MGTLVDRKTGATTYVDDADMPSALSSGKFVAPDAVAVDRSGLEGYALPDVAAHDATVAPIIDPARAQLVEGHSAREARNSGLASVGKAALGGLVSGATGDMFSPFEEAQEFHGGAALAGGLVGGVAGAELAGGLLGDAGRLAEISSDPVDAERASSALSSKYMFGGGEATSLAERGLADGAKQIDKAKAIAGAGDDIAGLDMAGLRGARDVELDRLGAEQVTSKAAARSSAVDGMQQYQAAFAEANPYLVTGEGSASAPFAKSSRVLRNALDDVEGLREAPGSLLKPLRLQAQALEKTIAESDSIAAKFDAANGRIAKDLELDLQTLPDSATEVELTGKAAKRYGAYADVKVPKGAPLRVGRDDAQGFLEALQNGQVQGEGQAAMGRLQGLLDQNRALQTTIKNAAAPAVARGELTSERIKALDAAKDVLSAPKAKPTLAEEMMSGSIMGHVAGMFSGLPIVGPMIGAKAGQLAKDVVFGRLGKAAAGSAARSDAAMKTLFDVGKRAVPSAAAGGIAATRVLSDLSFGPPTKSAAPQTLADAFHTRANEIKAQTYYDETGTPRMRPEARDAMAAKLAAIKAVSPKYADQLEAIKAAGIEFLASKLPRRPDFGGMPMGPDKWQPSDMEMRQFARYASAVEDPHGVEDRLASGTLSPEDVEAYHAVYPERANALKAQILAALPTLQKPLPYHRRLALTMFTGTPVDPSMHPQVLAMLQNGFVSEPGTAGGTQAPRAEPQFGSVAKTADELSTPAQQRALGSRG